MTAAEATAAATVSHDYRALIDLPERELEARLVRGETPDPAALAGWEYRGTNTPRWASLLGIRKFIKGFYRDDNGACWGYNVAVAQDGLDRPWTPRPPLLAALLHRPAAPRPFGFYRVDRVDPTARDNAYLHALLLDYGAGGNPLLDGTGTLRDYLVRIVPGSDELLLGKAYLAVGPVRVAANFFVLERLRPAELRPGAGR